MPRIKRLSDGAVFDGTPDQLQAALQSGDAQLLDPVRIFNPQDGHTYEGDPANAVAALKAGGLLEGSTEHTKATTGKLESFGRAAVQSLTGGLADELVGGVESLFTDKKYTQARDESRHNFQVAEEANPGSSLAGSLAGGFGSALVPGMGVVGKGLSGALATGAKLGAIHGFGNSTADLTKGDVGGAVRDTVQGAGLGALAGGATNIAGQGLSFVGSKVGGAIGDAFDPQLQRLMALGAKGKDLLKLRGSEEDPRNAASVLEKLGIFARGEGGALPDTGELLERVGAKRAEIAQGMHDIIKAAGNKRLDLGDIMIGVREAAEKTFEGVRPGGETALLEKFRDINSKILATEGDLAQLWNLKKISGSWAKWDASRSTDENKLFMAINQALGKEVVAATDAVASRMGQPGLKLSELNKNFGAIANVESLLAKTEADKLASSSVLGSKFGDFGNAGLGMGIGGAVGGAPGAMIGGAVAQLGGAAVKSTEGRLLRAQVGQALQEKFQRDAQAAAMGAIPRTVDGVKQFFLQDMRGQMLLQSMPQLQGMVQRLANERGAQAEATVRTMMPAIFQFMTPSTYPSEFEGKLLEPQDRLLANKQIASTPGLSVGERARRQSAINTDGTMTGELFVPQKPGASSDPLLDFSQRLQKLGY